jgi:hypothetical protein
MKLVTIKKALPVLWRYLLVVCVSCGLAYFISQSKVYATPSLAQRPTIHGGFKPKLPQTARATLCRDVAHQSINAQWMA